jgi:hypothetical protein
MTRKSATPRRQGRDPEVDPRPTGIDQGPNGRYRYKALAKLLQVDEPTLKKIAALAAMQATRREAAGALAVSLRTFEAFLATESQAKDAWQLGRQQGRASLRRRYYEMALVDPAMMRHAAKHYLGMDDKQSVAVQSETTVKVLTVDEARARAAELIKKMGLTIDLDNVDARRIKGIMSYRAAK